MFKNLLTIFEKSPSLGHFERLCLGAVQALGDDAYGIAVHDKVEELGGRSFLLPASYVTLDRLEEKGYLKSWQTEPIAARGGRRRRCYALTPAGIEALKESAETAKRLYDSWSTACKPSRQKNAMSKVKTPKPKTV